MRVAIIGLGVIGQAQTRLFADHEQVTFDVADGRPYPRREIAGCDFAVLCVGTPARENGEADMRQVTGAFFDVPFDVPVMIRSTVPPRATDTLRAARGGAHVVHVPEFMGENPAHPWQESADVPYMLLGGPVEAREFFRPKLASVFPGPIHECKSIESELAKYAANLYWATRVTFVNELAAICDRFHADYGQVREAWLQDPRMTRAYTAHDGHPPGFGGRCWPKDLSALIAASSERGYVPGFLEAVEEANERFRS